MIEIFENLAYQKYTVENVNWNKQWEEGFQPVLVDDFVGMEALAHDLGSVVAAVGLEELCRRQGRTEEMTRYGTLATKAWHRAQPSDLAQLRQKIASLKPDTRAGTGRSSFGVSSPGE